MEYLVEAGKESFRTLFPIANKTMKAVVLNAPDIWKRRGWGSLWRALRPFQSHWSNIILCKQHFRVRMIKIRPTLQMKSLLTDELGAAWNRQIYRTSLVLKVVANVGFRGRFLCFSSAMELYLS